MCEKAVWESVDCIENHFYSDHLSFCSSDHPNDGSFVQLFVYSSSIQMLTMYPAPGWVLGTRRKLGQFLLLQADGGGNEYTVEDSMGNTCYDKGKAQRMDGNPQRWPVQPKECEVFLRNECLGVSQMKGKRKLKGKSVCRAQWYEAASSVSIDGINASAVSSFVAISLDLFAPLSWLKAPLGHTLCPTQIPALSSRHRKICG